MALNALISPIDPFSLTCHFHQTNDFYKMLYTIIRGIKPYSARNLIEFVKVKYQAKNICES